MAAGETIVDDWSKGGSFLRAAADGLPLRMPELEAGRLSSSLSKWRPRCCSSYVTQLTARFCV